MTPPKTILKALLALVLAGAVSSPAQASDLQRERPFVGSIEIIGNEHISDGRLKKVMRTKEPGFFQLFNRPRLRSDFLRYDLAAIEAYYRKNGYYQAVARIVENRHDESKNSNHIVIEVIEGEQTLVGEVRVVGDVPFDPEETARKLRLRTGAPFDSTQIGSDIYYLRNRMWDEGYVLADIDHTVKVHDHTADITYRIAPGPRMYVGRIDVRGNRVASEKRVREQLTFKTGDRFSLKSILDSQQNLFDTSLFRQVNLSASRIDTVENKVDLVVEVEERKMSYVELGLGIGTEDNGRVAAEWGHRYVPGLGGNLRVNSEFAFDIVREGRFELKNRFSRAGASYTGPRFPGTRFQTAIDAFLQGDRNPQTVDYDVWGFGVHGRRRIGWHSVLYLEYTQEFVRRRIPELEESSPFTRTSDETHSLGATVDRDTRNDLLYPSGGSQRSLALQVAGGPVRGDNHFVKVVGSISVYRRVFGAATLAARLRAGVASPYGRSNDGRDPDGIPFEDRFYAGGSNSVRGYKENSLGPRLPVGEPGSIDPRTVALRGDALGGEVMLLTNLELRFPIWKSAKLGGVLFLDGGNVWEEPSDVKLSDFKPVRHMDGGGYAPTNVTKYRYSFGLGLRYNTPIGPLRLDYGVPVSRTGEIRSFGMFHFNLGHAF